MQRKNHETELKCPIGRMIPGNHLFPWSLCQTILYSPGKSVLFFRARRRPPCREFPPHVHLHSEQALPAFQSGLTCVPTKPCLACNQALLGLQSGLTCNASATSCETGRYGRVKEQGKPIIRQPPLPTGIPIIRYFSCGGWLCCFFSLPLLVRRPDIRPLPGRGRSRRDSQADVAARSRHKGTAAASS